MASGNVGEHRSERWSSVIDLLDARAAETPDAPAVCFAGRESTYSELAASTVLSARWLLAAGVSAGDRVAILLREGSETYASLALGALRLGAICLPINARCKAHELTYLLGHAEPAVLFSSAEFAETLSAVEMPAGCRQVTLGARFEPGEELAPAEEVAALTAGLGRETPALLLYTSGTTARPKGCVIPHRALLAEGANCTERLQLTAGDRLWTPLAMFHVGGWQGMMAAMVAGGAFSHVGFFEAGAALDQLEGERCTVAFPAFELIWLAVLDHPRFAAADLSALRIVINVGVPERLERMQERLPHAPQVSCMGMTESCGSMCMGAASDPLESRITTSGRPFPGMELRIVTAAGEECPAGTEGELQFRGITAFEGYFRDPETTAATVLEGGWIRTGDLACVDADGMVQFRGRLKDMLKVGGENVSAPEVEGFLITHPAVSVAAVVGAPDARYGEVPAAFVQTKPGERVTEEELIEYCVGRIATFKVPRYVRVVERFPTTATEKIQKFALRDTIADDLRDRGVTEAPKPSTPSRARS